MGRGRRKGAGPVLLLVYEWDTNMRMEGQELKELCRELKSMKGNAIVLRSSELSKRLSRRVKLFPGLKLRACVAPVSDMDSPFHRIEAHHQATVVCFQFSAFPPACFLHQSSFIRSSGSRFQLVIPSYQGSSNRYLLRGPICASLKRLKAVGAPC